MKLLYILITLAFVNVARIMTAHYANSVFITNKYIKETFDADPDGLATAISNIINDNNKTIATLNSMLAIPEKANFWITIEHDEPFINNLPEHIAIADEEAVQQAIFNVTNIPVPQLGSNETWRSQKTYNWICYKKFAYRCNSTMKLFCIFITLAFVNVSPIMTAGGNWIYGNSVYITNKHIEKAFELDPAGLKTVITNLINGSETIAQINLKLAIPEKAKLFSIIQEDVGGHSFFPLPEYIRVYVYTSERNAIADQEALQKAITKVTNIPVPQLEENQIIPLDSLPQLGINRRLITGKVTKELLLAAIDKGSPEFKNHTELCRLVALLKSIRNPHKYVKTAEVDSTTNKCILKSFDGTFIYKPFQENYVLERPSFDEIGLVNVKEQIRNWFVDNHV
ncbi:uncharacterized protein LOC126842385 isoform X1 [Adelges cooleyi]|uniref:uncharacterized protein LOC126842385 isoform X1 n=1 Tax=Adelges cooleyi TaxID=133065 RepID=UPI00217F44F5|nr:uncharacterized protein LOC126842385 isoform X1 [Adelges cooleyi]